MNEDKSCPCGNDCPAWQSREGDLYLCEMSVKHLQNALNWLRRKRREVGGYWPSGEEAQDAAQAAEDEMDSMEYALEDELDKRAEARVEVEI